MFSNLTVTKSLYEHWSTASPYSLDLAAYIISLTNSNPDMWLLSSIRFARLASKEDMNALRAMNCDCVLAIHPEGQELKTIQRAAQVRWIIENPHADVVNVNFNTTDHGLLVREIMKLRCKMGYINQRRYGTTPGRDETEAQETYMAYWDEYHELTVAVTKLQQRLIDGE